MIFRVFGELPQAPTAYPYIPRGCPFMDMPAWYPRYYIRLPKNS
nr:MAG TPA: hypothetical protein [Bacteriophage sp.]